MLCDMQRYKARNDASEGLPQQQALRQWPFAWPAHLRAEPSQVRLCTCHCNQSILQELQDQLLTQSIMATN